MLKLDRLSLSGFKSFVDPVSLEFAGGLTSIVGPNGCGKSNLADAVTWVLGERSAKTLRGERMEDVIFTGSQTRKPLGLAEVTLDLVSDNGFPHSDDGRIRIGRKLFRSGESEYLINGRKVRLKDVKDLLMDTGLGIRAYSMIEQGKIGTILSGKPLERRRLLEEAAGVTRYRERRRIAEIKLEEARGNLDRLDDIVSEIERALRSLKRQASAARRYQQRQQEEAELHRKVLAGRWSLLSQELAEFSRRLADHQEREAEMAASLHRDEAEYAAARQETDELARELAQRHRREADLAASVEGKQEFLKGSRSRLEEIGERMAAGRARSRELATRAEGLERELAAATARRLELLAAHEAASREVGEDDHKLALVQEMASEAGGRVEALRGRLLSSIAELTGLRNRLHKEQVEQEKGSYRRSHLAGELETKNEALERTAGELGAADSRLQELEAAVADEETALAELNRALGRLTGEESDLQEQRQELRERLARVNQRRELLTDLEADESERRERLRRALAEAGLESPDFLADRIRVPEGWEDSLDLYLENLSEAVILPADRAGADLAGALAAGGATGRLLRPAGPAESQASPPADPAVRLSLGEALGLDDEIARALPPACLVDSPADAERLARRHPGTAFISRERLWAQSGLLHVRGEKARPGRLARRREAAALEAETPRLEAELEELEGGIRKAVEALAGHRRQISEHEHAATRLRQELAVARVRREDLVSARRRLEVERQTLATEDEELGLELGLVVQRSRRLAADLQRAEVFHSELEKDFDRAQAEADRTREERESARTSGASLRGKLDLLGARLESHHQEEERLRREIDSAREQIGSWSDDESRLTARQAEIKQSMEGTEQELQQALEQRDSLHQEVVGQQELLEERRAQLEALEGKINTLREDRDGVRAQIGEVRVEEAGVKQAVQQLKETFRETFDEELPEEPGPPPAEMAEWQADLERCRQTLERLGPVNLLAASEYEEQQERHEFLTAQRADVAASVDSLRKTIREINETSSKRFLETFEVVNGYFGETFTRLFRGGEAEMRLMDDEDILESGLEIVARPPGKRLQNIMLLSGGEKALTAIALLFALFRAKPSPFCILDEVDAPLDDVNTLRFVQMLRDMSRDVQFVIITHNKITMEASSVLYGVTMQEKGVSNLVSVELDEVQEPEPARAATG